MLNHSQRMWSILTVREREIFNLLVQDQSTKQIAEKLSINEKTVRNHISNVIQKLDVRCRTQAILELYRIGELEIKSLKKN
jgi:LuxR family transcriptional regulator, transcriptional regulator of spore coat protein